MPLSLQGRLEVHSVAVKENISIAPQSEAVIQGEVIDNLPNIRVSGLIEPVEEFLDKGKAFVAKTVVTSDKIVPIRLLNPNENVQILRAGTVVGNLTEVAVISQVSEDNRDSILDRELGKILEKSSRNLSKEESKRVSELLLEFKELFAVSDSDLGHTDRVKHKIETGASKPGKKPPRRTPVSLR